MTYRDKDALHPAWPDANGGWAGLQPSNGWQHRPKPREHVLVDASWHAPPAHERRNGHAVVAAVRSADQERLHRLVLPGVASSMQAEMLAIQHGLGVCWDRGWPDAVVVTDNRVCELLANRPGQGGGGPHMAKALQAVRHMLRIMPGAEVVWAPRARVTAAHNACR